MVESLGPARLGGDMRRSTDIAAAGRCGHAHRCRRRRTVRWCRQVPLSAFTVTYVSTIRPGIPRTRPSAALTPRSIRRQRASSAGVMVDQGSGRLPSKAPRCWPARAGAGGLRQFGPGGIFPRRTWRAVVEVNVRAEPPEREPTVTDVAATSGRSSGGPLPDELSDAILDSVVGGVTTSAAFARAADVLGLDSHGR